jgi:dTDP-4-dehydrorhamnose 3,5-epimerase
MPFHLDDRGVFMESYNRRTFMNLGLPVEWRQDNLSVTKAGVVRGMHMQRKNPQGKLIQCLSGEIIDVALDMRPGYGYGRAYKFRLVAPLRQMLYIPPKFAHGFHSVTDSIVTYKCTTRYDKQTDGGVNPLKSGIDWELEDVAILSDKDRGLPSLVDYKRRYG